ncbi:protein MAIN-LIKE 1-like [Glycine soja]|uniref:protein MAIN-LIKE 1-like n=1 Tax=Glycine soja TaxID=3848 RepID=UPI001040D076|nr:protein MAIN-LIKE 1-like [Glycine soja]
MVAADVHDTGVDTSVDAGADDAEGFPGGPRDPFVLMEYADHIAVSLSSHGRNVQKLGRPSPKIEGLVASTGLSHLIACSVDTGNRGLISSFVKRWHTETSSFHLPVGEFSITLDDVASFLHLRIVGAFHTFQPLHVNEAMLMLVELLEVSGEAARAETTYCHGPYCWIYKHFPSVAECITDPDYDEVSPCACRWIATQATVKTISTTTYRQRLD